MTKFFRPATAEDFKSYEIEIDNYRYLSEEDKKLIENGAIKEFTDKLRKETGMGLIQIKNYYTEYQGYLTAKKDFEDGKSVFVPY